MLHLTIKNALNGLVSMKTFHFNSIILYLKYIHAKIQLIIYSKYIFVERAKVVFTKTQSNDQVCYNLMWEAMSDETKLMDCFSSSPKNSQDNRDVDRILNVSLSVHRTVKVMLWQ